MKHIIILLFFLLVSAKGDDNEQPCAWHELYKQILREHNIDMDDTSTEPTNINIKVSGGTPPYLPEFHPYDIRFTIKEDDDVDIDQEKNEYEEIILPRWYNPRIDGYELDFSVYDDNVDDDDDYDYIIGQDYLGPFYGPCGNTIPYDEIEVNDIHMPNDPIAAEAAPFQVKVKYH
jgi:hypothetical protein